MKMHEVTNKFLWVVVSLCLLTLFWMQPTAKPLGHHLIWYWTELVNPGRYGTLGHWITYLTLASIISLSSAILLGWVLQALLCVVYRFTRQRSTSINSED